MDHPSPSPKKVSRFDRIAKPAEGEGPVETNDSGQASGDVNRQLGELRAQIEDQRTLLEDIELKLRSLLLSARLE